MVILVPVLSILYAISIIISAFYYIKYESIVQHDMYTAMLGIFLIFIPISNIYIMYDVYRNASKIFKKENKMDAKINVVEEKELLIREVDGVYLAVDDYNVINLSQMKQFEYIYMIPDSMKKAVSGYKLFKVVTNGNISYKLVKTS